MNDPPDSNRTSRSWPGYYYDGQTSARQRVTVWLAAGGMTIEKERGNSVFWPYAEVTQPHGEYAGEAVRFERGAPLPESVVIEDPSFLPSFQTTVAGNYRHFHFPAPLSRRIGLLIGAGILSLATIIAVILWGIPAIADLLSPLVPPSWEVALGKAAVSQLAPHAQRCTNEQLLQQTQAILTRVVSSSRSPYDFHLTIVDGKIFNAFALPGGEIVVMRPLLQGTHTSDELAGVLAHEAQHVLLRHTTRALLRDMSLAMLIGAVFGDISGITALAVQAARTLSTLHYSREMEEEADKEGLRLLQRAHIHPYGMIRFFETLKEREEYVEVPAYLSTHPETERRVTKLRAMLQEPTDFQAVTTEEGWTKTRNLCR